MGYQWVLLMIQYSKIGLRLCCLVLASCSADRAHDDHQIAQGALTQAGAGSGTISRALNSPSCHKEPQLEQAFSIFYNTTCTTNLNLRYRWHPRRVEPLPETAIFTRRVADPTTVLLRLETYRIPGGHQVDGVDVHWTCPNAHFSIEVTDSYCKGGDHRDVTPTIYRDTQVLGLGPARAHYVFKNPCGRQFYKAQSRVIFENKSVEPIGFLDVMLTMLNGKQVHIEPVGSYESPGFPANLGATKTYVHTLFDSGLATLDIWAVNPGIFDRLKVDETDIRCR